MEKSDRQLKHLGFVKILAVNALVLVVDLYDRAKQSSGSLKSSFDSVENAVATVVGPVYQRIKGIPADLLVFLDTKVDEVAQKFDESAPASVKNALSKVHLLAIKTSQTVQDLVEEAQASGPLAAISHACTISQHIAVSQLALVWYKVEQHPALSGVSKIITPTTAYWSKKYNELVNDMLAKGYTWFNYVPLVPVEEFTMAYKQAESAASKKTDDASSSGSDGE